MVPMMERDTLVTHSCAEFLKERLFKMSDQYCIDICNTCGFFGKMDECYNCKKQSIRSTITKDVNVPYAAVLLFHEMLAVGIKIKLHSTIG